MGRFEKRRADFEAKGATLAAVSVDSIETSQALAKKLDLHFPILADPKTDAIRAYGVQHVGKPFALPAIFVVAPDGRIAWKRVSGTVFDRPPEEEVLEAVSRVGSK